MRLPLNCSTLPSFVSYPTPAAAATRRRGCQRRAATWDRGPRHAYSLASRHLQSPRCSAIRPRLTPAGAFDGPPAANLLCRPAGPPLRCKKSTHLGFWRGDRGPERAPLQMYQSRAAWYWFARGPLGVIAAAATAREHNASIRAPNSAALGAGRARRRSLAGGRNGASKGLPAGRLAGRGGAQNSHGCCVGECCAVTLGTSF